MTDLYIAELSELCIPKALERVTEARRQKALRYGSEEKMRQSLGAALLLYRAVNGGKPFELSCTESGKPYCEGMPFFSLSHSGDYAVCAVSELPVGVDIELPGQYSKRLAERCFPPEVCRLIGSSTEPEEKFCELWTLSESRLKASGEGIWRGLRSLDLSELIFSKSAVHLKRGEYHISVCVISGEIGELAVHDEKII